MFPVGLPTREVSFGQAVILESGAPLAMRVQVKASRSLVHTPSGQPLVSVDTILKTRSAGEGVVKLPVCDAFGMSSIDGTIIDISTGGITHSYDVEISYLDPYTLNELPAYTRVLRNVVILSTMPARIDLDSLVRVDTTEEGVSVLVPDAWTGLLSSAQAAALAVAPSFNTVALTAASPNIPSLGTVNNWTVTGSVQVGLPAAPAGSQFTVHVISGFQGLTWPPNTTVYGATSNTEAWVTLIRTTSGWAVLVPSAGGGGGMIDTGWTQVFGILSVGGALTYNKGDASMLGTGWGAHENGGFGAATLDVRRSGNQMLVRMSGFKALSATPDKRFISLPPEMTASFVGLEQGILQPFPMGHTSPLTTGYINLNYVGTRVWLELASPTVAQGIQIGPGIGGVPGATVMYFPISKTAPWGI